TCSPDSKVLDALLQANNKKCGACIVIDAEKKVFGIVTDGDFRRAILKQSEKVLSMPVSSICSLNPKVITKTSRAWNSLLLMRQHRITTLTVIHEEKLVGIIHMHQLLNLGLN